MFEFNSPESLFGECKIAMQEYSNKPNGRLFLFLIFTLNHLREWIAGGSASSILNKEKNGENLTKAEIFCIEIWSLQEFKTINSLCNSSKHVSVSAPKITSISTGFHVGGSCGDSLDQTYYNIDGIDSRYIFYPVMKKYHDWFSRNK